MSEWIHRHRLGPLLAASVAGLIVAGGCHDTSHYWVLTDVSVTLPAITGNERPTDRGGNPAELLDVVRGGSQTVLIAADLHDDPEVRDDERGRSFVVVLDGPPAEGACEITPDNARLIAHSVWWPPRKPYNGVEGQVKILSVSDDGVSAKCVLRNVLIRARDDSYTLRGRYRFRPPDENDDLRLRQAGIRFGGSTE